jgi:hypothetical protein
MAPSWADVAGGKGVLPNSTNSSPTTSRYSPSSPFTHLLQLYRGCVQERRWARFTLETCKGEEQLTFCCSGSHLSAAVPPSSSAAPTTGRRGRKRRPNERRREKERKRYAAWLERRRKNSSVVISVASPSAVTRAAAAAAIKTAAAATIAMAATSAASEATSGAAETTTAVRKTAATTGAVTSAAVPTAATTGAVILAAVPTAATTRAVTSAAVPTAAAIKAAVVPEEKEAKRATTPCATSALRERSRVETGDRRTSARASELARRRDGSALGTPENLRQPDVKLPEMDISLDFEEREVFSPPCEQDVATEKVVPEPEMEQVQDFTAGLQASWSEEEKREWKIDMEKIAERLAARLPAATMCRKKKKRK